MAPQPIDRWSSFETAVAEFYRSLGANTVRQNANLGGSQIDVYVEEQIPVRTLAGWCSIPGPALNSGTAPIPGKSVVQPRPIREQSVQSLCDRGAAPRPLGRPPTMRGAPVAERVERAGRTLRTAEARPVIRARLGRKHAIAQRGETTATLSRALRFDYATKLTDIRRTGHREDLAGVLFEVQD